MHVTGSSSSTSFASPLPKYIKTDLIPFCFTCLGVLIGVVGYHLIRSTSVSSIVVLSPPLWPLYFTMEQNITTIGQYGDSGRVIYDWEKKAFRAGQTNLFNTGCHFEYLWIKTDHYVYNDTFCCKYQFKSTLHLQAPDWLRISNRVYLGMQTVNNATCRTWYSPIMQSFYWDRVIDGVAIPFRWDNNMDIEKWSAGSLTTLFWNVNLKRSPSDENALQIPSYCQSDAPALCPHRST